MVRKKHTLITSEAIEFIRQHYHEKTNKDIAQHLGISVSSVARYARINGLTAMARHSEIAQQRKKYIKQKYADGDTQEIANHLGLTVATVYKYAAKMKMKKSAAWWEKEKKRISERVKNNPLNQATQFQKGNTPWHAGKKITPHPNSIKTQFKKGENTGKDNPKWVPIGSSRVTHDGYLQIKVNDDLPLHNRWKSYHVIVWEQANGPVPDGCSVSFKNGLRASTKNEIKLENLELISNADLLRKNSIHRYPPELVAAMQLLGRLDRQIEKTIEENKDERNI